MISEKLKWRRGEPTAEEFASKWILEAGRLDSTNFGVLLHPPGCKPDTWWPNTWFLVLDIEPVSSES